ncbi:MAG: BamA/TamA family outer membrane protein, partial [Pseudomonadota bacterium]
MRDISFSGNQQVSARQIKKKIVTQQTGWWPFATKHHFDPVAWQSDLARIERLYETMGHYQAEVMKDQVIPDKSGGVKLAVRINEGELTRIGRVDIAGVDKLPEADGQAALDDLPLRPEAPFLEGDWNAAKNQLRSELRGRGYATVDVDGQALVDVSTHRADLKLAVSAGRHYRFGDIRVDTGKGTRIAPVWIWEQARLAAPEGASFSDDALEEAQRRVSGMGVFAMTKVTAGAPDPATSLIPVDVEVREAPPRTLRLGGGARIDQIRNEARAIGEWTHRDFRGGMRRLMLRAEAGWAFIPNTYAVLRDQSDVGPRNGPIFRLRLEFEQPRLLGRPSWRERSTLVVERTMEQSYNLLGARLQNGVIWQPRGSLTVFPSHNLESSYLNGPPISGAATAPLTLGCASSSNNCLVWLSYLEEVVTWDRRGNALDPRDGFYASVALQQGGGPLLGDFTYLRVLPDVRGYVSFGEDNDLTLSARARVGALLPRSGDAGDSAVVTRFYGGGGASMRGFSDRRLSPLLAAPAPGTDPNARLTLPIGGNGLIEGNFEVRYSLTANLRLAVFADFGQVTRDRLRFDDLRGVLWAVGVGLRYLTP